MKSREVAIGSCLLVSAVLGVGVLEAQLWAQAEEPAPLVVTEDTTWSGSVTVDAPVNVEKGTLTISPGSVVTFKEPGVITLSRDAALSAKGTAEKPIRFAGDNVGQVRGSICQAVFEHVQVSGVGVADGNKRRTWLAASTGKGGIAVRWCSMTNAGGVAIRLEEGPAEITGCEFRGCEDPIRVSGKRKALIASNTLRSGGIAVGSGIDATVRGNVIIGGTLSGWHAKQLLVEGNYVHQPLARTTYGVLRVQGILRNNVVRGGTWVTSQIGGQITGNVFISVITQEVMTSNRRLDQDFTHEHICGLVADSTVSRNIFVGGSYAGVMGIGEGTGSNSIIRNNTFDMRGRGQPVTLNHFPENKARDIRIRNNIFMRCGPVWNEWGTPGSVRSIDYNLWADAGSKERFRNFKNDIAAGMTPGEPGFGGHDVPPFPERATVLSPASVVVNPDVTFPFTDEEMLARRHAVAEILKVYRDAYTLKPDSPAINAGDPTDRDDPTVEDGKPDIGALERAGK